MITRWLIPFGPDELARKKPVVRVAGRPVAAYWEELERWPESGCPRWMAAWFERGEGPVEIAVVDACEHVPQPGAGVYCDSEASCVSWPGFAFDPQSITASGLVDGVEWLTDFMWTVTGAVNPFHARLHGTAEILDSIRIDLWLDIRHENTTVHGRGRLTWLQPCAVSDFSVSQPAGWVTDITDAPTDEIIPAVNWSPIDWQPATLNGQLDEEWLSRNESRTEWASRVVDPTGHGISFEFWTAPDEIKKHENLPVDPARLSRLRWMPDFTERSPLWLAEMQSRWANEYIIPCEHSQAGMQSHPLTRDHGPAQGYNRCGDGTIRRSWQRFAPNPYGSGYWAALWGIATGNMDLIHYVRRTVRQVCDLSIPWLVRYATEAGSMVCYANGPDIWGHYGRAHDGASREQSSLLHIWTLMTGDPIAAQTLQIRSDYLVDFFGQFKPDENGKWQDLWLAIGYKTWKFYLREFCIHYFVTGDERFRTYAKIIVSAICDPESYAGINPNFASEYMPYGPLYKADWSITTLFDVWDVFGIEDARDSAITMASAVLDAEAQGEIIPGTDSRAIGYQSQRMWWLARWYRETRSRRVFQEVQRLRKELCRLAALWNEVPHNRRGRWHFEHGPDGLTRRYWVDDGMALEVRDFALCSVLVMPLVRFQ
jgi:hypothetical protein